MYLVDTNVWLERLLNQDKSFFFQAEDGIRDTSVTGVQTCALPIYPLRFATTMEMSRWRTAGDAMATAFGSRKPKPRRSEERRVGKECRSGGSWDYSEK